MDMFSTACPGEDLDVSGIKPLRVMTGGEGAGLGDSSIADQSKDIVHMGSAKTSDLSSGDFDQMPVGAPDYSASTEESV